MTKSERAKIFNRECIDIRNEIQENPTLMAEYKAQAAAETAAIAKAKNVFIHNDALRHIVVDRMKEDIKESLKVLSTPAERHVY